MECLKNTKSNPEDLKHMIHKFTPCQTKLLVETLPKEPNRKK